MVSINGNTKPKIELLIKKEKNAILTHRTLSVKVTMQELQFINLYHHSQVQKNIPTLVYY